MATSLIQPKVTPKKPVGGHARHRDQQRQVSPGGDPAHGRQTTFDRENFDALARGIVEAVSKVRHAADGRLDGPAT